MLKTFLAHALIGCVALGLFGGCRQAPGRARSAAGASAPVSPPIVRRVDAPQDPRPANSPIRQIVDWDRRSSSRTADPIGNTADKPDDQTSANGSGTTQSAPRFAAPRTGALLTHGESRIPSGSDARGRALQRVAFEQGVGGAADAPSATDEEVGRTLVVPPEIPGAESPSFELPRLDPDQTFEQRRDVIRQVYEALPELPPEQVVESDPDVPPLTLADLQHTAYSRSPLINRAWADIDAARGRAVQAGLCPNPVVGYEGDTINTLNTAGYNGLYFEQTYVTAGKLDLAQQAALMEVRAVEYAYRRARVQVAADVRRAYFGVLMAQERVRLARAMSALTQRAYEAQIELVAGGESAAYEPLQLRVLALKARNDVITAENAYLGSWRALAAALNYPEMHPIPLAGSVETGPGALEFEAAKAALLTRHTDLSIAQAQIAQQNFNLELQRVTPVPNLELYSAVQHDDTNSRNDVSYNVQIGLPLPLWNRNQGNISAAHAELIRAQHNWVNTRNELSAQLAEAFARFATARELALAYRSEIVPNQVQTFRGVYTQFREVGGEIDFAQVIVSQQSLSQVLDEYLAALSNQWDAAVDLSELLQVEDIYSMDGIAAPPVPPVDAAPAE